MWEAAGSPPAGSRPGEGDIVARTANGTPIERYMVAVPETGMTGDIMALGTFAGAGVGEVRDIPPAAEVVRRLWREYEQDRR